MLYHLLVPLTKAFSPFNVFRYVTFRTAGAFLTALLVCLILGPPIIRKLTAMRAGQVVRNDGPQSHLKKAGTPTMGGVLILLAVVSATILWAQLTNQFVWLVLFATLAMGAVGFADDYLKLKRANSTGLRPQQKFFWQILIGLLVGGYLYLFPTDLFTTKLAIPFFKAWLPELGVWYIPFAMLVVVGCANAVNLTDGLDGLAIVPDHLAGAHGGELPDDGRPQDQADHQGGQEGAGRPERDVPEDVERRERLRQRDQQVIQHVSLLKRSAVSHQRSAER